MKNEIPETEFKKALSDHCPANDIGENENICDYVRAEVEAWAMPLLEINVKARIKIEGSTVGLSIDCFTDPDNIYTEGQCPEYDLFDVLKECIDNEEIYLESAILAMKNVLLRLEALKK